MSHFSVLVFTEDDGLSVDELLEPYYEGNTRAPYIEYTKQEAIDYVRKHYPDFKDKSDEECWEFMSGGFITDKQGNLYSTANPDAKWDWYEEGGRWKDFLRLKDGTRATSAKIKDVDFSINDSDYQKALRYWDLVVEHKPLEPGEEMPFSMYKPEYYKDFYGDRETYARRQAGFHTFAVVTSDGIWLEEANMGWFAWTDATPKSAADWENNFIKNFIDGEDPEKRITVVDCHV